MSAPRTNKPTSPTQEKTSCWRSRPVDRLTSPAIAAPPIAPANVENIDSAYLPVSGDTNAPQASEGSSPSSSLPSPDHSCARSRNGPSGTPVTIVSSVIPSPFALNAPVIGPSLSSGRSALNCSNCCATSGSCFKAASRSGLAST